MAGMTKREREIGAARVRINPVIIINPVKALTRCYVECCKARGFIEIAVCGDLDAILVADPG